MATITRRHWKTSKGEAREAWVLAFTDKAGQRHKEQYAKKREADARRVEVEGQISSGAFRADAATKTVKDAVDAYLTSLEKRHRRGEQVTTMYLRNTSGQLRGYIVPEIGDVKLASLTARSITDMVDRLKDAGVAVPTIRRVVGALSRALTYAIGQDLVATNVARAVRITGRRGEGTEKITPPSKADMVAILSAARTPPQVKIDVLNISAEGAARLKAIKARSPDDMHLRVQFAAATALRASEQWALRWRHIDLAGRSVRVETRVDAYGDFDTTKTESGTRSVPLGVAVADALALWRGQTKFAGDEDFVFPDSFGGYTRHTNFVKRRWQPLLEAAKTRAIGWHALRHFAISTWIEAGLQPKAVQTLAGHASFAITMTRYGHMFPNDDHVAAMDKIAAELYAN